MNEKQKSLELAKLMGWNVLGVGKGEDNYHGFISDMKFFNATLKPYADDEEGLAQFAAILLKFPEAMLRFENYTHFNSEIRKHSYGKTPTQTNILDEILAMHGVKI